jgi:hypothetical protein
MLEEFIYQFLAVSVMSATWNGPNVKIIYGGSQTFIRPAKNKKEGIFSLLL